MRMDDEQPLFDMVESDQLVVFTGAGFSFDFRGRNRKRLPGWKPLLQKVRKGLARNHATFLTLSGEPADDLLDTFFQEEYPRGEHLIEAATILRRADPKLFKSLVDEHLKPADVQPHKVMDAYAQKHRALLALQPRGIVTVNVDRFHEDFLRQEGLLRGWSIHDPVNEHDSRAAEVVRGMGEKQFLIKAHGTLGKKIVFDYDAYRELIEKTPSYTAMFSYLFSHYRMLFIGFGLSDLDFDLLIDTSVRRFGSPLQEHLTLQIKRPKKRSETARIGDTLSAARAARLRERFGIRTLEFEPDDLVSLLERAAKTPGVRLQQVIQLCASRDFDERRQAHRRLKELGSAGKRVAMQVIHQRIRDALAATPGRLRLDRLHEVSELTYSLGKIDPAEPADRRTLASNLLDIVESTTEAEIVAHALWALTAVVQNTDLRRLRRIRSSGRLDQLVLHPRFNAPPSRCHDYLNALIARVSAERHGPGD